MHFVGQPSRTFIGEVARVEFLVDDEVERLDGFGHVAVVVLHVVLFRLEHTSLDTLFREIFDERLVLRQ